MGMVSLMWSLLLFSGVVGAQVPSPPPNASPTTPTPTLPSPAPSPITRLSSVTPSSSPAASQPGTVFLGEQPLFVLYDRLNSPSVEARAKAVSQQVESFARNPAIPIESLQVGEQGEQVVLFYGSTVITPITEQDASALQQLPRPLAQSYVDILRKATTLYRQAGTRSGQWFQLSQIWEFFTTLSTRGDKVNYPLAIAYTILATLILALVWFLLNSLFPSLVRTIRTAQRRRWLEIRLYKIKLFSSVQVGRVLLLLTQLLRLVLMLLTFLSYLIVVLNLYPLTQKIGGQLFGYSRGVLLQVTKAITNYIPSALIIGLIILLTYYTLRVIKPIFNQLGQETIKLKGFYPEWAEPTYRLVEIFVLAIAAVLCFPYLPGFGSDAFQSLSIFLGVLVSLGSTTAVANAVSGVILIYTRAFRLGDYIAVGEVKGAVEEKSILVTRVRTPNNVIVTIPNAMLIANSIQNYSISGRDTAQPVVLTTTITLGYDMPWTNVYAALTAAAQQTPAVLQDPPPEVWQTTLGDFSVTYEIRVYTDRPTQEPQIHSALHQNIQDACNAADIEILSPTYAAVRDGNNSTIPADYLPADYKPDGFKLNPLGNLFQVDLHWGSGKAKAKANGRSPQKQ
ncbi:MAG: mechanosensitive ion channel family protein [Spirulina sp. SIO3F2]|nr:mechanosensitive ion channel family protein [Spirulina sp. SIO3F2]